MQLQLKEISFSGKRNNSEHPRTGRSVTWQNIMSRRHKITWHAFFLFKQIKLYIIFNLLIHNNLWRSVVHSISAIYKVNTVLSNDHFLGYNYEHLIIASNPLVFKYFSVLFSLEPLTEFMYKLCIILMTCSQASTKAEQLQFQKIIVEKLEKVLCHTVQI